MSLRTLIINSDGHWLWIDGGKKEKDIQQRRANMRTCRWFSVLNKGTICILSDISLYWTNKLRRCKKHFASILKKKNNMREQELEYLRGELNQHLQFSNENTHKLFGHIILVWGGTLALFSTKEGGIIGSISTLFMMATIFFISVVVLYFLAHRNFESIKSMSKIAAYISIFYEEKPATDKDDQIFWEFANFGIDKKMMKRSDVKRNDMWNNRLKKGSNGISDNEYFCLSIVAIFIQGLIWLAGFNEVSNSSQDMDRSDIFMAVICSLYIIGSAYLSYIIFILSFFDSKRWLDLKKFHRKYYLEYAIETGHYTEDEAKKRFGENFYKEIMGEQEMNLPTRATPP